MQDLKLNQGEKNILYIVCNIDCSNVAISRRLTELGFVVGSKLKILQFSALKKTLLLDIEGYILSLRASVAELVKVKEFRL